MPKTSENLVEVTKPQIVCYVGGKSGGHIIPCLTEAKKLKANNQLSTVLFVSTKAPLDQKLIVNEPTVDYHLAADLEEFPYKNIWDYPKFIISFVKTLWQCFNFLRTHKPEKIISMGGHISIPVALTGKLLGIPVELTELNVEPGQTTKVLAPLANKVFVVFEESKKYFPSKEPILINYPLKSSLKEKMINQNLAIQKIGLKPNKKTIFVMGGSQGSQTLNTAIFELFKNNPELKTQIQVIHQTGESDLDFANIFYAKNNIDALAFKFSSEIELFYSAADLIISRAGAGSMFEIKSLGKKCITVPLEIPGNNHQLYNALAMAKELPDQFVVVRQSELSKLKDLI
ncbi:MAG: UDP-N-acetylglucosamine-N-acetylmuramyl-(pentapeptide) pyrophosphoryl-UDP N-acetylglucosamine transferase [candidate division TM6 bacterium GW2011_GWF2_32_72]|nr:MAG: UDP-N-acetylglucosamine-N-acetylmuramyl-(pentapeptide) pyrophosphoryl-UDP N-acetylglucosamine transferase [candidate division TM6 bacterium GW2011_GWF2_32_72]